MFMTIIMTRKHYVFVAIILVKDEHNIRMNTSFQQKES